MKIKKIVASLLTAAIFSTFVSNVVIPTTSVAADTDYSYLDSKAYNGSDLGATYTKTGTTFKVWAPTASKVQLKRYTTGSDGETNSKVIETLDMTQDSTYGLWSVQVPGDIVNTYYTYLVTVNGTTKETPDVYGKTTGVNGNRTMVVDLSSTDPTGWTNDKRVQSKNQTDSVIWEGHVRDFSIDSNSGVSATNRGKYTAFTETGTTVDSKGVTKTGIDYLKDLGVTHVQIMPSFDYASVDETNPNSSYNWGYDPKNYNVPEGSYSTNPYDGNVRVNEYKKMVESLHNAGIGVIMDVVYNHTYAPSTTAGSTDDSPLNMTVPGYYYRQGIYANGSGCGNATASERAMYRKYMVDSVVYWAKEYHLDGFRFDLMGLHDVETMNEIRAALNKIDPSIKIVGEPWTGDGTNTRSGYANMANIKSLDTNIAAFNDKIRDSVKGSSWAGSYSKGYIQGDNTKVSAVKAGIQANSNTNAQDNWAKQPSQVVSYLSCHDNATLYDVLVKTLKGGVGYQDRDEDLVARNKLGAAINLTSQGIAFFQAGEEFARTKNGNDNSYNASDAINELDWSRINKFPDLVDYYKGLIAIRKSYTPFRDPTMTSDNSIYFAYQNVPSSVIAYTIQNKVTADSEWGTVAVLFNSDSNAQTVTLQGAGTLPTSWVVVANDKSAGTKSLGTVSGTQATIPAKSALILVDKASFDAHPVTDTTGTVVTKYIDKDTGTEIATQDQLTGKEGASYTTTAKAIDGYIVSGTPANASGNFINGTTTVTYTYVKDTTPKGTVTVKYIDSITNKEVTTADVTKANVGTNYSTVAKSIDGYVIDDTASPGNASGTYTNGNVEVDYYYIPAQNTASSTLKVHYYNANSWTTPKIYAYDDSTSTVTKYSGEWPGTSMTNDGNGWWSYEVKSTKTAKVIINNGSTQQEPAASQPGYSCTGEVNIKDKTVTNVPNTTQTGFIVRSRFIDSSTNNEIATSTVKLLSVGDSYTVSAPTISGYTFDSAVDSGTGKVVDKNVTVIYKYKANTIVPIQTGTVTAKYIDKDTKQSIASDVSQTGNVGDSYTTSAKAISGYTLSSTPINASGKYTADPITATYEYIKDTPQATTTPATSTATGTATIPDGPNPPDNPGTGTTTGTTTGTATGTTTGGQTTKTGDNSMILYMLAFSILGCIGIVGSKKRKTE